VDYARRHQLIVVLKGHQTVVTDGQRVFINPSGNPGMATGGTGDVLTGLTAALLGQGLEPFAAAQLAVYLHGLAGDLARDERGEVSLIATDLIDYLPRAFLQHQRGSAGK
jgi:NAD(P)H-hydrate epimerase